MRYTLKVAQTYLIGIMPAQSRLFTILQNVSGTSGWKIVFEKINRRRLFVSFQRKTFSSNGTSEKVVLFLRTEFFPTENRVPFLQSHV